MNTLEVHLLGQQPYETIWAAMSMFTQSRHPDTADMLWVLEHSPVFTLGQAGQPEHLLQRTDIPLIETDRGGQITYHGPGQVVIYTLLDIKRLALTIRDLVTALENAMVSFLASFDLDAHPRSDAPGVYIGDEKIASIGLRIKRGCSYHGIAFNVDMDLTPFTLINPCGQAGLKMTQLCRFDKNVTIDLVQTELVSHLQSHLGYTSSTIHLNSRVFEHYETANV